MIYDYIVRILTKDTGPVTYLDACAAPGGKTTTAIDALPEGSAVVANEYVAARAAVLRENLIKWGYGNIAVSRGDTRAFRKLKEEFDIIAADVPCSGEGMFRKDPEALAQWSPALVAECAARQREIVDNLWPALKSGGHFIYSTCTFNRDENEDIVAYIAEEYGAEIIDLPVDDSWGIIKRDGCMHFLPGRVRGEGLTVAVLRKPGTPMARKEKAKVKAAKTPKEISNCRQWLRDGDRMSITVNSDRVTAVTDTGLMTRLAKSLDLIYTGIEIASIKGRDVIPSQALSMCTALSADMFATADISYRDAIAYLRRESVTLDENLPTGYVLLSFRGHPLGFVKNLGRRTNNLYPQAWRILSSHGPEEAPKVIG